MYILTFVYCFLAIFFSSSLFLSSSSLVLCFCSLMTFFSCMLIFLFLYLWVSTIAFSLFDFSFNQLYYLPDSIINNLLKYLIGIHFISLWVAWFYPFWTIILYHTYLTLYCQVKKNHEFYKNSVNFKELQILSSIFLIMFVSRRG